MPIAIKFWYLRFMVLFLVSKYRPYLTSFVNGRNDYINAVCVPVGQNISIYYYYLTVSCFNFFMHIIVLQSFVDLGALIITQMPLPDTEVDLWRLCVDHDIQAIVILNENNEVPAIYCDCLNVLSVYFLWRCKVSLITTRDCKSVYSTVFISGTTFNSEKRF